MIWEVLGVIQEIRRSRDPSLDLGCNLQIVTLLSIQKSNGQQKKIIKQQREEEI